MIIIIITIITLARSLRCLTLLEVEDDPFSPSLTLILCINILINIISKMEYTLFRVVENYCYTLYNLNFAGMARKRNLTGILLANEKEKNIQNC